LKMNTIYNLNSKYNNPFVHFDTALEGLSMPGIGIILSSINFHNLEQYYEAIYSNRQGHG
jgi:hypothetical protein